MTSVAIIQSNYIPWKGYFDIIAGVDHFIVLDEVQYTKNDWCNRNQIKTSNGLVWLTLPVGKGSLSDRICDKRVTDTRWSKNHLRSIEQAYAKADGFNDHIDAVREMYARWSNVENPRLSDVNMAFIRSICALLGITTEISTSTDHKLLDDRNDRLISLVKQVGGDRYVSGPAAQAYMELERFASDDIAVDFVDYGGYPEYEQRHGDFVHGVSVIDVLLSAGSAAPSCLKNTAR